MTKPQQRSRFTPSGIGKAVTPTPYVRAILELLRRYRYLPKPYIHAFVGGDAEYLKKLLTTLFHEGYVGRPAQGFRTANARYLPAIYELRDKGARLLDPHGRRGILRRAGEPFQHELMACLVRASFELGASEVPGLRYISGEEILNHPKCPEATRRAECPFAIPLGSMALVPDAPPFGYEYTIGPGEKRYLFFLGFEADRHTEPLSPRNLARSSIHGKYLGYLEAAAYAAYRTRYGIPNCLFPFITVSDEHMRRMMALLGGITGGKGSAQFLFKSVEGFTALESYPRATGHMLTESWHRVGHPSFNIVSELSQPG